MEKKGDFKTMGIQSLDECHEVVSSYFDRGITILLFLSIIIGLHFVHVVYTHWKNFGVEFSEQVDEEDPSSQTQ